MNFNKTLKEEVILKTQGDFPVKAFLSGIVRSLGAIILDGANYGFLISTNFKTLLERVQQLIFSIYNVKSQIQTEVDNLNKSNRYTLTYVGVSALTILSDLEILDKEKKSIVINTFLHGNLLKDKQSKRAFIQGTFLGAGSCTVPNSNSSKKTSFHLELVFHHYDSASVFTEVLSHFDIFPNLTKRRDCFIVYLKSWEQISDFIAVLDATKSMLTFMEIKAKRDINNATNRQVNCDFANMDKQGKAADKQILAIKKIEEIIGLNSLDASLKYTAQMRLENRDMSLSDLANKLQITKSGLNHRLTKLIKIAENLQN